MTTVTDNATTIEIKGASYSAGAIPAGDTVHTVAPALEAAPEVPAADPRDSWPARCDEERWTIAEEAPAEDGPRPSWDAPRFEPDPLTAAYLLGFELGKAGESPEVPAHLGGREAYHFMCGRIAGFAESEDGGPGQADVAAHRDRAFAEFDAYREPRECDGYAAGYCS